MPLVTNNQEQDTREKPVPVRIAAPSYKGIAVDTRYTPTSSLLTHIEGSSWTVNYFSQVLNDDTPVTGLSITRPSVYQQYILIEGMELKVTTSLANVAVQEPVSRQMALQGGANVYPFLIPNNGDMFLADIGTGKLGLFRITSVDRKTIFEETCHAIEYVLVNESAPEYIADLERKTVQRLKYVSDFLAYGQNPLVVDEEYAILKELANKYHEIANRYFKSFLSNEYKTLVLPGQELPIYDHFMTKTVMSFFTTWDTPEIRYVRKLNCDGDPVMDATTIWDVLARREPELLRNANRKTGLVLTGTFTYDPMMDGIYHSGIRYVVYPEDEWVHVDYQTFRRVKQIADWMLKDRISNVRDLSSLLGAKRLDGIDCSETPLINEVLSDDFYVFSQAFYENTPGQSKLELCVRDYLNKKALDNKTLLTFCETCHAWGALEKFYYIPIVLMLIKASIRSV